MDLITRTVKVMERTIKDDETPIHVPSRIVRSVSYRYAHPDQHSSSSIFIWARSGVLHSVPLLIAMALPNSPSSLIHRCSKVSIYLFSIHLLLESHSSIISVERSSSNVPSFGRWVLDAQPSARLAWLHIDTGAGHRGVIVVLRDNVHEHVRGREERYTTKVRWEKKFRSLKT